MTFNILQLTEPATGDDRDELGASQDSTTLGAQAHHVERYSLTLGGSSLTFASSADVFEMPLVRSAHSCTKLIEHVLGARSVMLSEHYLEWDLFNRCSSFKAWFLGEEAAISSPHAIDLNERTSEGERIAFLAQLTDALAEDPVEPGYAHRAERLVTDRVGHPAIGRWIRECYESHPEFRRSIVLCIGRIPVAEAPASSELVSILKTGLSDDSTALREAAIRSLEELGALGRPLLESHVERVPWLKSYVQRVLARSP